jgi:hypothetical protein
VIVDVVVNNTGGMHQLNRRRNWNYGIKVVAANGCKTEQSKTRANAFSASFEDVAAGVTQKGYIAVDAFVHRIFNRKKCAMNRSR